MKRTLISSIVAVFALVAVASAQQPPVYQAGTEEVVLDVVVRDKRGRPIKDLKQDEIRVEDDGREQKILSFRLVEGREAIENGARVPLDAMKQIRLVTLVFERLGDSARRIARQAAEDLVKGEQGQNVYFAVVALDAQLYALQEFTTDKEALKKAIARATSGQYNTFVTDSDRIKSTLTEIAGRAGSPQTPQAAPATPEAQGAAAGAAAIERRTAEIMLEMLRFDSTYGAQESTRRSIFALLNMVRGQYALPGRKSIIYFSEGLWIPPHLDEPFRNISSAANRGNVSIYSVDTRGVMTFSQNRSAADDLAAAARQTASDITATDGRVSKEQIMAADRAETSMRNNVQMPLRTLAESTGGFLIGDSNDLRAPLRQVNEEINSYYEITYAPGIETYDGRFRKTDVRVSRKDTVVHARNGYFALPVNLRGPAVMPYELALLKALDMKPFPRDIEFRAAALHMKPVPEGLESVVIVEVPMSGVQFTEDKAANTFTARLSLIALLKDQTGAVVSKLTRDLPLNGALAQVPQLKAGNFIYKETMTVPAGRYTLETAVLDHEARKSSAKKSAYVVAAQGKGVAMTSLFLVRNFEPNAKNLDDEPLQYQGGRITPTLSGQIFAVKGAQLSTFFTVYPDASLPEKPTAAIEFLLDGKQVARSDLPLPAADAQGRIAYVMSAPAENLPPGVYEIHVVVKQGASATEQRTMVTVSPKE